MAPPTISIHALLAESDRYGVGIAKIDLAFLSTLSLRRATEGPAKLPKQIRISIHALLAESDNIINCNSNFEQKFLSTLSLRRATISCQYLSSDFWNFYPRSPCGERHHAKKKINTTSHFYPRSPCGERPPPAPQGKSTNKFLSTLSLRRATNLLMKRY